MSTFAVLLLCVQACLVQNVYGQWGCNSGSATWPSALDSAAAYGQQNVLGQLGCNSGSAIWPSALNSAGVYGPAIAPASSCGVGAVGALSGASYGIGSSRGYPAGEAAYGGAGEGNVEVIGELPVSGTTAVAGQVPILGAVNFGGPVPAAGAVSICGQCSCGCNGVY